MVMLKIVSEVRSLWRKAFLTISLRRYIVQDTFIEVPDGMSLFSCPGIVGHHDDSLMRMSIELIHQAQDLLRGYPVKVSGRLVRN